MTERIALFIDGNNVHFSTRALGFEIDYRRLLFAFASRGSLLRAYFYTTTAEESEFSSIRPLTDWLDYNGFTVRTKPAKNVDDGEGRRKLKRNIGVDLAVDALEVARHVDHIILFSGDGSFRAVAEAVQKLGTRVTVVSTIQTRPPMAADELRRQADCFIDLLTLRPTIERQPYSIAPK